MTVTTAKWTIADYHAMGEAGILDDRPVELLNGEIVEMAPEGTPHAHLSTTSADYLRELVGKRVLIRAAKPITLPNSNSEPEPDIAIVAPLQPVGVIELAVKTAYIKAKPATRVKRSQTS